MVFLWLCDHLVSSLPGACAPEGPTAFAEQKGRTTPEIEREGRCPCPLTPGAEERLVWSTAMRAIRVNGEKLGGF